MEPHLEEFTGDKIIAEELQCFRGTLKGGMRHIDTVRTS